MRGPTVIVGAGPAGLAAAHELAERGLPAVVYERDPWVGGIARTAQYRGYRFDLGGHRFFTKVDEIQRLWEETLGEDLLVRPRLSRIHYRNRFFRYPLKPLDALAGLGAVESARVLASYAAARAFPRPNERTFEHWVVNRFGRRLYEIFFETYTEKVWGIPCSEISADWAAQRIRNLDLLAAVRAALGRPERDGSVVASLIERFHYPRLGPGMMWERWRDRVAARGVETHLQAGVETLYHENGRIVAAGVRGADGREERVPGDHFVVSMPLRDLVRAFDPPPPPAIRAAGERLRYRDFLIVVLIADVAELFPDNWIYVHSADVRVGRVQNFKNWSADLVPDPAMTSLGLEYFVQREGDLWTSDDADLVRLGADEADRLGLVGRERVRDGTVVRVPDAYPVYDPGSRSALAEIRAWLEGFPNLYPIGRNGQHRYNNQDHSMMTGLHAARTIAGTPHPIWDVNVEAEYHEERREGAAAAGDRLVPEAAGPPSLESLLRAAFARWDPVALGAAVGAVAGAGLFLVTAVDLLLPGADGPPLFLLGQFLFGYEPTWRGAAIGLLEAGLGGFAFGWVLALLLNLLIGWNETVLQRELELLGTIHPPNPAES